MSASERAQRHEPLMSATCRAEQHQDQPDDVTHVCRWLSHAGPVHNCICGHSWENTFEDRVMAGFAPALMQALQGRTEATECTCGNTYETHQGPEPDCPAHGAVRAFNEVQAENERLHSWAGLLSLLDEHWPEGIFPAELDSETRDPGPRIVSLLRWVERLRAEQIRIATEIEAERKKTRQAEGATARDENVINGIVNGLGIALKIVRGTCKLCGGAGVVPGSEDYDTAVHMYNPTTGEPCDCVLRSES